MAENQWWEDEAASSLERKAAAKREADGVKLGDSFLIVTEGTVTEPEYFKRLRDNLKLSAVDIHVQPSDKSHPYDVIAMAVKLKEERAEKMEDRREDQAFSKTIYDHVWAVIDTDVAARDGIWKEVKKRATAGNVHLASSMPCFEFWLLLHLRYTAAGLANGAAAKAALKAEGFDCSTLAAAKKALPKLIAQWPQAVRHAERVRKHHIEGRTPEPANPSTRVDLLLRALDDSVPVHRRKL